MNETLYSISEELIAFMRKMEQAEAYDEERGDGFHYCDPICQANGAKKRWHIINAKK